jgi:sodium-dependent dicarboxylate transporter 2/3/5
MEPKETKKLMWLVAIVVAYFVIVSLPLSTPLPADEIASLRQAGQAVPLQPAGQKSLALMIVAVFCWVMDVIPMGISSVVFLFLQAVVGIEGVGPAVANFATPTLLFVLSSFLLANAMAASGFSKRFSMRLSLASKGSPKGVLFLIMMAAGVVSMVISDPPVVAAFFPVGLALCEKNKCVQGKSNFAKAVMMGITFSALIGGIGTPAGSSLNVQALGLLESSGGQPITFAKWATLGVPFALVMTAVAWASLCFVFKPEMSRLEGVEDFGKDLAELGPMSANEKKWLGVMLLLVVVWLSEKYHHLPVPVTTTLGAALFFLPVFGFLDWKAQKIGWDLLLLIGAATSLGTTFYKTGGAAWLANLALGGLAGSSVPVVLVVVVLFTLLIHVLVPTCPAIAPILVPTLVAFANNAGMNPWLLAVPTAFTISAAFQLPLDPTALITYAGGYYNFGDFIKAGTVLSLLWLAVLVGMLMALGRPLGFL